mmetsp:Transcript_72536/g.164603  ORF Transcript_72536/g.164603 Transcript_72536/m.164603 type:complete len:600 (+) Transcript_72536:1-1800(+)
MAATTAVGIVPAALSWHTRWRVVSGAARGASRCWVPLAFERPAGGARQACLPTRLSSATRNQHRDARAVLAVAAGAAIALSSQPARGRRPPAAKPSVLMMASRTSSSTLEAVTDERFEDLEGVSTPTKQAISKAFKYVTMTKVQAQTIEPCLSGSDVVAKAKTGTGKTLGFLIPAVETGLVRNPPPRGQIAVLCLSPTRELALQTADEARTLLTFHGTDFGVQCVVGGTNVRSEQAALQRSPPAVLIATPGRLIDHMENSGLKELCQDLRVLIFDEADQLLDMGFRRAINQILDFLPSKDTRQTLLFSATFPQQVDEIARVALRCQGQERYQMIDTVGEEEAPTHKIPQSYLTTTIDEQLSTVMAILAEQTKIPGHKVMVFLPAARHAQLFAQVFNALVALRVFKDECVEIHSRKSQTARKKASAKFRDATEGVMITSDVSARGMDYPNVTFVLQCGIASSKAQYVHRLGRTARAGKSGSGLLVLNDFEEAFGLSMVKDLPIKRGKAIDRADLDGMRHSTEKALGKVFAGSPELGGQAYQAVLGFYNSYAKRLGMSKPKLVQAVNHFATEGMMLSEVPTLTRKTVGKMGLKGTPGLFVA